MWLAAVVVPASSSRHQATVASRFPLESPTMRAFGCARPHLFATCRDHVLAVCSKTFPEHILLVRGGFCHAGRGFSHPVCSLLGVQRVRCTVFFFFFFFFDDGCIIISMLISGHRPATRREILQILSARVHLQVGTSPLGKHQA